MLTLIERPPSQRKYLREIEIFLFPPPSASIKNIPSIFEIHKGGRGVLRGGRQSKISSATKYFRLSSAFISFFLSLLFHLPKWNIQGSKCSMNSAKLDQICSYIW